MSLVTTKSTSYVIPARPEALISITQELRTNEPNIDAICQCIKLDVALFTSVISTINSAYYGLGQKITSIERAVSLLGVKRIFNIIQLAALQNSLSAVGPMDRFWDTATEVARICAALSKQFSNINSDDAYTLGMLHDSGIPLMMLAKPDYKDFLRTVNGFSLIDIHNAELAKYNISHYHLGAELAKKWNIEDSTTEAIRRQAEYEATFTEPADDNEHMRTKLCLLLLSRDISDAYRHFWRIPEASNPLLHLKPVLTFLGISDYDYLDLKEDIVNELSLQQ